VLAVAYGIFELAVDGEAQLKAVVVDGAEPSQRLRDARPRRRHELLAEASVLIGCVAAVVVVAAAAAEAAQRRHQRPARARRDDGAGASALELRPSSVQRLDETGAAGGRAAVAAAAAAVHAAVAVAAVVADGAGRTDRCCGVAAEFGLLARPVLVVGVFLHVQLTQTFRFLDVGRAFVLAQRLPPFAQTFRDLGVVHVRLDLADLTPLDLRPHHERVHRPLDVVRVVLLRLNITITKKYPLLSYSNSFLSNQSSYS